MGSDFIQGLKDIRYCVTIELLLIFISLGQGISSSIQPTVDDYRMRFQYQV